MKTLSNVIKFVTLAIPFILTVTFPVLFISLFGAILLTNFAIDYLGIANDTWFDFAQCLGIFVLSIIVWCVPTAMVLVKLMSLANDWIKKYFARLEACILSVPYFAWHFSVMLLLLPISLTHYICYGRYQYHSYRICGGLWTVHAPYSFTITIDNPLVRMLEDTINGLWSEGIDYAFGTNY